MGKVQKKQTLSVNQQLVYLGTQYPDFDKAFFNFTTLQFARVNAILLHARKKGMNPPTAISENTHKCLRTLRSNFWYRITHTHTYIGQ